jgi:hypothetical protein
MTVSAWSTAHLQGIGGLIGGTVLDQLGDWPSDSSPPEAPCSLAGAVLIQPICARGR